MLPIKTRRRKKPTKNPIAPLPVLHYFYFVSRALKYTTTTTTTTTGSDTLAHWTRLQGGRKCSTS